MKRNVYITPELAARMRQRPDINFSLLAQQAWERALNGRDWLLIASVLR